ncbi:MAG TPA: Mov34/MPN/PAD-1 family protein, partial [Kofleriaceae bacterium]|nr:Mov34/MPN/PAD-1 family protein [Kofleriaceae bacterium]
MIDACEAAWPREACGWITDAGVHVARGGGVDAFAFADAELLALAEAYRRGPAPRLLFHSHPRGPATMSAADRAALAPGGVVLHALPHLIVGVRAGRAEAATLHRWAGDQPVLAAWLERAA